MLKYNFKQELACDTLNKRRGNNDEDVLRVQEWINLQKYTDSSFQITVQLDGFFGPATQAAILEFQKHHQLSTDGIVGSNTWSALTDPMQRAFGQLVFSSNKSFRDRIVAYALLHLAQHPTEFYKNKGPWVRSYCNGKDGIGFAWCAGFVTTIVDLAASSVGRNVSDYMKNSLSCNEILRAAMYGKQRQHLLKAEELKNNATMVEAGDLFVTVDSENANNAFHMGVVIHQEDAVITTIEGNVNDQRSCEGIELCKRFRDLKTGKYDIIKLSNAV